MILAARWTPEIILFLARGPTSYGAIYSSLGMSSDKTLCDRLRRLEDLQLVARHVDPGPPFQVSYALTERAVAFVPSLREWAKQEAILFVQGEQPHAFRPDQALEAGRPPTDSRQDSAHGGS